MDEQLIRITGKLVAFQPATIDGYTNQVHFLAVQFDVSYRTRSFIPADLKPGQNPGRLITNFKTQNRILQCPGIRRIFFAIDQYPRGVFFHSISLIGGIIIGSTSIDGG